MKVLVTLLLFSFMYVNINSQTDIEQLGWLSGSWHGEKWGGEVDEYWSKPQGNSMMGMFRLVNEGEVTLTEFFVISEFEDGFMLKLKHFDKDFVSWEEKGEAVEFKFVEMSENKIVFEGLSYELMEDGRLKVVLKLEKEDKVEIEEFFYEKSEF